MDNCELSVLVVKVIVIYQQSTITSSSNESKSHDSFHLYGSYETKVNSN